MAFVPPTTTASSFLGSKSALESTQCPLAARPHQAACPRMSFSSIDMPEKAIFQTDTSLETKAAVIEACYKHVFGNAYVMEEERAELAIAESEFMDGQLNVREFIRALAKSEEYRKRFFSRSGPYRFIELNFKHLLGRGPTSHDEITFHVKKLMEEGYDAEIDSYLDSDEYEEKFGGVGVPRFVFEGTYQANDHFNRMTVMRKFWDGCSTSTTSGSTAPGKPIPAQLLAGRGGYVNGFVNVMKGLPAGFRPAPEPEGFTNPTPGNARAGSKVRIKVADNLYQVFEIPPLVPTGEPEWKKEVGSAKKWNGIWY